MEDDPEAEFRKVVVPGTFPIKITKWKVRKGTTISKGVVLALYDVLNPQSLQKNVKLKSTGGGIVQSVEVEEEKEVNPGSLLLIFGNSTVEPCSHPTVMKDMCAMCGADLRSELGMAGERKETVAASVAMVHSIPELIISEQQALELGQEDENRLLKTRKLVLLVDLDQTLIHTTNDNIPANLKGVSHFQLWHGRNLLWYHTRFRPHTREFLEKISKMYELHICTFGVRMYAHTIARLLDPDERFFSHRILSRDECFNAMSKTANLKALFPCGDSMVCIIDDREDVWNFSPNLIHVKPYRFFQGTADINAPQGLTKTENDGIPITHRVRRASDSQDEQKAKTETAGDKSAEVDMKEVTDNETSSAIQVNGTVQEPHAEGKSDTNDNTHKVVCQDESNEQKGPESLTSAVMDSKENTQSLIKEASTEASTDSNVKPPVSVSDDPTDSTVKPMSLSDEAADPKIKSEVPNDDSADSTIPSKVPNDESADSTIPPKAPNDESADPMTPAIVPNDESADPTIPPKVPGDDATRKPDSQSGCQNALTDNTEIGKESPGDGLSDSGDTKSGHKEYTKRVKSVGFKVDDDEEIEWDDEDDYLYHLEEVLTRIHTAFYDLYDQTIKNKVSDSKLPNLKDIIPYVKRKVLKGCSIVFSGVVPLNMQPERSRAYVVARALGANIQSSIVARNGDKKPEGTTHLVAAKPGTAKVNAAYKVKGVKIVNVNWLWSCAERWERVEEKLFPLEDPATSISCPWVSRDDRQSDHTTSNPNKRKSEDVNEDLESSDTPEVRTNRSKKARLKEVEGDNVFGPSTSGSGAVAGPSTEAAGPRRRGNKENTPFSSSYNPLLSFSDEDIEFMDKEVEETMEEDGSDSEEEDEEDREERLRKSVLGDVSDSSSEESLAGDFPRGWNIRKRSPSGDSDEEKKKTPVDEVPESDTELESYEKTVEAFSPEKDVSSESGESIGSVDDEIADAVEKEFLSLL
ncbi:LOW QUALITY PROTEIN: RNA polymerase II subunit A C-terminal domain phosphatase-like [Haliotis rubra]|uniref:LOW QUALITY PROTEIN: RNA polymerase II subunit A C-terminal domain phosphatase-like n=1 Tax=Haliotis rubra TaxID=36100 RepID=UPI001EE5A584|nr:LOW QUALITY PROTEIN: RNA polymerase II subunit A C-terminal domain phosphatase-like [Haliotis rubra]